MITLISVGIVMMMLIMMYTVNLIMMVFNDILFRVLKILLPISVITGSLHYFTENLIDMNIDIFGFKLFTPSTINVICGIITVMYTYFLIRKKNVYLLTKLIGLILLIPMIIYLLNEPIEYMAINLTGVSFNNQIMNVIYNINIIRHTINLYDHYASLIDIKHVNFILNKLGSGRLSASHMLDHMNINTTLFREVGTKISDILIDIYNYGTNITIDIGYIPIPMHFHVPNNPM